MVKGTGLTHFDKTTTEEAILDWVSTCPCDPPNTDVNILYNVMNYPNTIINSQSYRSSGANMPQMLTNGQVLFLLNEINLQKNGAGLSTQDPYWFVFPGIPVK